ncbi:PREDICTED: membrane-spanning 4-domains subfamily A member 14 [Condylura cristata]|uniref:membrane-spanning 4-domains subfamily A member 14 n=1 Tax=Condylura cristata TaxID=143302 RepID=UPI000642F13F|nr:PREDICTED: membrane-spanning 4-domains subfamily A member 14 [Condylura cristata]
MESSSKVRRSTPTITIQPNETILTAIPFGPQSSLLEFLKGEPKVLGVIQILLGLVMVAIGIIFLFNFFSFSHKFPLVFITGYPFWGALIFILAGHLLGNSKMDKCVRHCTIPMSIISSLTAVAGIVLTIISYKYQHMYCQQPSLDGICVMGRSLFNGILSVLLIISIVELSISVTIAAFKSKCWTRSNEIVFFLPSDFAQDSELSIADENAVLQFELEEESSSDSIANIQPVFFGGYTFYKLRLSRNPLAFQQSGKKSNNNYYVPSITLVNEQQKSNLSSSKPYETVTGVKSTPSGSNRKSKEVNDEDLKLDIGQPPKTQAQLSQDQSLPHQDGAHVEYQDIQSEVMLLTQGWKHEAELHSKKYSKWNALHDKDKDKYVQVELDKKQPSDEQAPYYVVQSDQSLKEQPPRGEGEEEPEIYEVQPPKQEQQQTQEDRYENWPAPEEPAEKQEPPKQPDPEGQAPDNKVQDLQQYQNWMAESWKNTDWRAQELQLKMQQSLNVGTEAWQAEALLEKELLQQKALFEEAEDSERNGQHISLCSSSYKDDLPLTSTSCYPKEHSEDSD